MGNIILLEEGNLVNFHNVRNALYARKSTYSEENIILFVGEHLHVYTIHNVQQVRPQGQGRRKITRLPFSVTSSIL